jgi:hypothetical protein
MGLSSVLPLLILEAHGRVAVGTAIASGRSDFIIGAFFGEVNQIWWWAFQAGIFRQDLQDEQDFSFSLACCLEAYQLLPLVNPENPVNPVLNSEKAFIDRIYRMNRIFPFLWRAAWRRTNFCLWLILKILLNLPQTRKRPL